MKSKISLGSAVGIVAALCAGLLMTSCASTSAPAPNIIQRVQGETPAAPPPSGFLGSDYALLKPPAEGSEQKAMLAYTNPNANFATYHAIIIEPVTFWADSDSSLSADQQQILCNYFYGKLQHVFYENFTVVTEPGPGVLRLSVALSDASSATPALRTISVVVPQAKVLGLIKYGLTGTYAFVGSATGEAKLTDSMTGELLAAWADQRFGSGAVKNAGVWQWGDAEHAMDYWAEGLDQRLVTLGVQNTGPLASQ
jgi:Protein of unknown function (DUF3313)